MKRYTKILLLVALALMLLLTACSRSVSKAPVASPTPTGEAPFPFTTPDAMSTIKTQTAVALTPVVAATNTPQVIVATVEATVAPDTTTDTTDTTGGTDTTGTTDTNTVTNDSEAGGGISSSGGSVSIPEITRPATYTLQKGEFPICIARRFDLDISSFFAANGLNMNSKLGVGTVLTIPSSGTWSANYGSRALRAHPATYTVVSGDTLNGIACKYGDVSPEQILAANNLSSAADVKSGMNINIP